MDEGIDARRDPVGADTVSVGDGVGGTCGSDTCTCVGVSVCWGRGCTSTCTGITCKTMPGSQLLVTNATTTINTITNGILNISMASSISSHVST